MREEGVRLIMDSNGCEHCQSHAEMYMKNAERECRDRM